MIVCLDFDGVANTLAIKSFAKKLVNEKNEVWIVTKRGDNDFNNKILEPILTSLNLTKYNVIFCNNKPKIEMLEMLNADIYIDNEDTEFENISRHTNIITLLYNNY